MPLEFCCPVCKAPLAIQTQAVGAQVNCPNCQKLILLPSEPPLPRVDEDTPPFNEGQSRSVEDIAQAIHISVEPYRHDLENKSELLNDAVEMIKTRNERIKEVESLMLETQRDLWALEVEYGERKEDIKRTQKQLREMRKKYGELEETLHEQSVVETEHDWKQVEGILKNRITELEHGIHTAQKERDEIKTKHENLVEHAEQLEKQVRDYREFLKPDGDAQKTIDKLRGGFDRHKGVCDTTLEDVTSATGLLQAASEKISRLEQLVVKKDKERADLELLVKSSSQDMQAALDDRKQWRNQALELEKRLEGVEAELGEKNDTAEELASILEERDKDLKSLKATCQEQEESLNLWRKRSERAGTSDDPDSPQGEKVDDEVAQLKQELEETREDQQKLLAKHTRSEKQRKQLKMQLDQANDQLSSLESS